MKEFLTNKNRFYGIIEEDIYNNFAKYNNSVRFFLFKEDAEKWMNETFTQDHIENFKTKVVDVMGFANLVARTTFDSNVAEVVATKNKDANKPTELSNYEKNSTKYAMTYTVDSISKIVEFIRVGEINHQSVLLFDSEDDAQNWFNDHFDNDTFINPRPVKISGFGNLTVAECKSEAKKLREQVEISNLRVRYWQLQFQLKNESRVEPSNNRTATLSKELVSVTNHLKSLGIQEPYLP